MCQVLFDFFVAVAGLVAEFDRYRLACEELGSWGIDSLEKISKAYDTSGANCESAVFEAYRSVIETFRGSEFQSRFLESVDRVHGRVISKLRDQIPSLGKDRIMLFAFLSQGLSYTTIGVILRCDSKQNLYNKRQRLVDTIKETPPTWISSSVFCQTVPHAATDRMSCRHTLKSRLEGVYIPSDSNTLLSLL